MSPQNHDHFECLCGKKVAIWGWYSYGNFGDDLMAVLAARKLKQLGASPRVYGLLKSIAHAENVESVSTLSDLLDGADYCVFGGGGLLLDDPELDATISNVVMNLELRQIPYCVLSVGGSGPLRLEDEDFRGRRAMLKSPCFRGGSRRLPIATQDSDEQLLRYIPDIVLTSGDISDSPNDVPAERPIRLGVNLPRWKGWEWISSTLTLLEKSRLVELVYIPTLHSEACLDYESRPDWADLPEKSISYEFPSQLVQQLKGLDGVLSYKLHLGVTALALGIPFVSVGGQPKTIEFMSSVGLDRWLCQNRRRDAIKLVRRILSLQNASTRRQMRELKPIRDQAQNHWSILASLCECESPRAGDNTMNCSFPTPC